VIQYVDEYEWMVFADGTRVKGLRKYVPGLAPSTQEKAMKFKQGDLVHHVNNAEVRGEVGYVGEDGIRIVGRAATYTEDELALVLAAGEVVKEIEALEATAGGSAAAQDGIKAEDAGDAEVVKGE
jgi:hypothetical protein